MHIEYNIRLCGLHSSETMTKHLEKWYLFNLLGLKTSQCHTIYTAFNSSPTFLTCLMALKGLTAPEKPTSCCHLAARRR